MDHSNIFIDGKWRKPETSTFIDVYNPATHTLLSKVPACTEDDLNLAMNAAAAALPAWESLPLSERANLLRTLLKSLCTYRTHLTDTIVAELGSPVTFTKEIQVDGPLNDFREFLNCAKEIKFRESHDGYTLYREPVGVVSCICPWNYPLYQLIQKVVPALLCGNTVVLKPSSLTPLSAYYFAQATLDANLPHGVFNLITGQGSVVGSLMAGHPKTDMVSFTGSTAVGKTIAKSAASTIKKVSLELGGKSPCLILEDANYDLAIDTVLDSCFSNSGQTCSALTRLFIPTKSHDTIYKLIAEKLGTYRCGNPADRTSRLGCLSSDTQLNIVQRYVEEGLHAGATLLTCTETQTADQDIFFNPCVFFRVTNDMKIAQEEIFGPVLCVLEYDNLDSAISDCNDSLYGLSACVFGEETRAIEVAKKIKAGNVHINDSPFRFQAPFGGYKQSGIGRESGPLGILEFTETKAVFHK